MLGPSHGWRMSTSHVIRRLDRRIQPIVGTIPEAGRCLQLSMGQCFTPGVGRSPHFPLDPPIKSADDEMGERRMTKRGRWRVTKRWRRRMTKGGMRVADEGRVRQVMAVGSAAGALSSPSCVRYRFF